MITIEYSSYISLPMIIEYNNLFEVATIFFITVNLFQKFYENYLHFKNILI